MMRGVDKPVPYMGEDDNSEPPEDTTKDQVAPSKTKKVAKPPKKDSESTKKDAQDTQKDAEVTPKDTERHPVKLTDTDIANMRHDYLAGKSAEDIARALGTTVITVKRRFHQFAEEERIERTRKNQEGLSKALEKPPPEKPKDTPPPVAHPANPPPASEEEKNTGAEIMADCMRGMSVVDMAKKHGLDESTANGFNRSFLVVKDIMRNTVPPQPNPNEGDGSKELTLGDEIPPEEPSRPGIYEVELSMKGVGDKETFSPTTFILFGILQEALKDELEDTSFGGVADFVFRRFCEDRNIAVTISVGGRIWGRAVV